MPYEHIYAALTDGTVDDVWAIIDPDRHTFLALAALVRELIAKKRGFMPEDVGIATLSFDPAY